MRIRILLVILVGLVAGATSGLARTRELERFGEPRIHWSADVPWPREAWSYRQYAPPVTIEQVRRVARTLGFTTPGALMQLDTLTDKKLKERSWFMDAEDGQTRLLLENSDGCFSVVDGNRAKGGPHEQNEVPPDSAVTKLALNVLREAGYPVETLLRRPDGVYRGSRGARMRTIYAPDPKGGHRQTHYFAAERSARFVPTIEGHEVRIPASDPEVSFGLYGRVRHMTLPFRQYERIALHAVPPHEVYLPQFRLRFRNWKELPADVTDIYVTNVRIVYNQSEPPRYWPNLEPLLEVEFSVSGPRSGRDRGGMTFTIVDGGAESSQVAAREAEKARGKAAAKALPPRSAAPAQPAKKVGRSR